MVLGDQVAPEVVRGALMRLYELTVGLKIEHSASALCMMLARKLSASLLRPSSPLASAKRLVLPPLSQTETWAWQPLPVRFMNGLGMKVARIPCFSAIDRAMYLKNTCRSVVSRQSS